VLDHHTHVALSEPAPAIKYKSGTEAFLDRLNATDMPAPLRARVAHEIQHVIKPTLLSKDAPPQQYGPFRGAVFSLRVRRGADLRGVNDSWRPMSKVKFDFLQAQAHRPRRGSNSAYSSRCVVVSQPVVVAKRGKDDVVTGYRAAFDFRKLNAVLEQDKLAPEPVRNVAEHASRAWRTTSLDATALFNQFELDEDSRFLTTVMIRPGAYYRFRCAPFGLSSILGFAQHALDEFIRADDRAVKVYVDDIVIAHCEPGDWYAAAEELLRVLRRCSERNLALNADKAELFQSKLIVVGHAIDCDTHTFRPRPARLQALAEFPRPTKASKLRGFLAMASAWSSFVPGWPMHQSLLSRFVSKHGKGPLVWTGGVSRGEADIISRQAVHNVAMRPLFSHLDRLWLDRRVLLDPGLRAHQVRLVRQVHPELPGHLDFISLVLHRTTRQLLQQVQATLRTPRWCPCLISQVWVVSLESMLPSPFC
jgi:hypothetical protein